MDGEHFSESKEESDREIFQAVIKGNTKDVDNVLKEKADSISQRAKDAVLILACRGRRKQSAKLLLNSGASFEFQDRDGNTALMVSAEHGLIDFAELLIRMGADVNVVNANGDTALILSINEGLSIEMLNVLIGAKANVDKGNKKGVTAMTKAIQSLDLDAVSVLLKSGATYSHELKTLAVEMGLDSAIGYLISHQTTLYRDTRKMLLSGFRSAAKSLDIPSMKLFLGCKLGCNSTKNVDGSVADVMKIFIEYLPDTLQDSHTEMIEAMFRHESCFDANEACVQRILLYGIKWNGNFRLIEIILKQTLPQDKRTHVRWVCEHPVKVCVQYGRCELIPLLLDKGFGVNSCVTSSDNEENVPYAVHRGNLDRPKPFSIRGAEITGSFLMKEAIRFKQADCLKFLLNKYPLEFAADLLLEAVDNRSEEMVEILISFGANPNQKFYSLSGKTVLIIAVEESELAIVRILLENGANVNYKEEYSGATCLKWAIKSDECIPMLRQLLDAGADINTQDDHRQTPLFYAILKGNAEAVAFLIRNGADPSMRDEYGNTALLLSAKNPEVDVTKTLLDAGADIDATDAEGSTALLLASVRGNMRMIEMLISKHASLNVQNNEGFTALMMAPKWNRVHGEEVTGMLVNAGADVNAVNQVDGVTTALSAALQRMTSSFNETHVKIMTILLQSGALPSPAPQCAFAVHVATVFGSFQLVQLLIENGFGPIEIDAGTKFNRSEIGNTSIRDNVQSMSPFLVALLEGKASIARYLSELNFFTESDAGLSSAVKSLIRNYLVRQRYVHCLQIWDDLHSQPWTLSRLSFVSVSAAIGGGSNRRELIEQTPLPPLLKRNLNFQGLDASTYTQCKDDRPEYRETESSLMNYLILQSLLSHQPNQFYNEHVYDEYDPCVYPLDSGDSDDYDDW